MCRRTAEVTAPGLRAIGECPRIDEDGRAGDAQRTCQRVGTPVSRDGQISKRAGIGDETDLAGGLEILAENEVAAFREGAPHRKSFGRVYASESRRSLVAQQPTALVVEAPAFGP